MSPPTTGVKTEWLMPVMGVCGFEDDLGSFLLGRSSAGAERVFQLSSSPVRLLGSIQPVSWPVCDPHGASLCHHLASSSLASLQHVLFSSASVFPLLFCLLQEAAHADLTLSPSAPPEGL